MNLVAILLLTLYSQTSTPPLADASVRGSIVRLGTADVLSKARVELRSIDNNNSPSLNATTADDGKFFFKNVVPGRYHVAVNRPGYVPAERTINLAPGQESRDIEILLTPTGAISGHVSDQNGRLLINADVQAMKLTYENGRRLLKFVRSVKTNDRGEYRLFWLAPGRYYVSALHPDGRTYRPLYEYEGEEASFNGVSMVFGGPSLATVLNGRYNTLTAPTYVPVFFPDTIDEHTATVIDLASGANIDQVDITVSPVRLLSIRGTIINSATGMAARSARLVVSRDPPLTNNDPYASVGAATGSFDVRRVLPGSYTLFAVADDLMGQASVQVDDADIEDVTIAVQPQVEVRGGIVIEDHTGKDIDLSSVHVILSAGPDKPDLNLTEPKENGIPMQDGSFVVRAPRGDYQLNVTFPSSVDLYVKSAHLGTADVLNDGLRLDRPLDRPLEIVMGTNPGAVEGSVRATNGTPVEHATVAIIPQAKQRSRQELYRVASSDASGSFRMDRIAPGNYKVFAWQKVEDGAWMDSEFIRSYEDLGLPIRVVEGVQESVDVTVIDE